jgi:Na+/phosphate symporter
MYKNFADLIAENEFLVKEKRLEDHDAMGDYLYIAKVDTADVVGEAWEIHLNSIGKIVQSKTERIEKLLIEAQKNLTKNIQQQGEHFISTY